MAANKESSPDSIAGPSSSSAGFSSNSSNLEIYWKPRRSKSLSFLMVDNYTAGEIRMIKERLLRTNSHLPRVTIKSFTGSQKATLAMLALVDFFCFCSMSIMAPYFPKEAAEKGLSATMSGIVFSFYALVMFLSSPVFGKIIPKLGAKLVFLVGMFVAGSCNILFGLLEYVTNYTAFTALCLLIRGLEALGSSAFSTASYVFVVNKFPNHISSVIVHVAPPKSKALYTFSYILGYPRNFRRARYEYRTSIRGIFIFGGFGLPFFVLGVAMIAIVPLNMCLFPPGEFDGGANKKTTVFKLIRVPTVFITGMVVVVVSSTWAFLDPTLEPHLRQFNLSPEKVGLIFLLFSGLYGLSSPGWGWLADKINNHWSMMVIGLFSSTIGLLLLGPTPYIPGIPSAVWVNLVALSILGISVALALMPTFQGVLNSAIDGGCSDNITTYGVVAGIWSSMYSLGEVIGPTLGGTLLQYYGFPVSATVMAGGTFFMGVITFFFFIFKSTQESEVGTDSGLSVDSWVSDTSGASAESAPLLSTTNYCTYSLERENKFFGWHGQQVKREIS
ncbi:MFS-type transporter SLC18B1-like isoform X1 [Euwallacea fornicatus]|uniref:MFS-type transporter SLC18B1-like isoform X1 n=1 Tax=Euwallacea fornicatus TaxID=995702 RepID=UPI00339029DE